MIPSDPAMLLSYVNTQLRDYYPSLEELCKSLQISEEEVKRKLSAIDYQYEEEVNQFIEKRVYKGLITHKEVYIP